MEIHDRNGLYPPPHAGARLLSGELVYTSPALTQIKAYAAKELDTLWGEYKRLQAPTATRWT